MIIITLPGLEVHIRSDDLDLLKVTGVSETPMHILFLKILVNNIQELSYGALCLGHVYITKTQGVRNMSVIILPRYYSKVFSCP